MARKKAAPENEVLELMPQRHSKRGVPRCRNCQRVLRPISTATPELLGYLGRGHFCSGRCAHDWADGIIKLLDAGNVLGSRLTLRQQKEIAQALVPVPEGAA